jgi:L-lactate dehydrogenase complex protein LldE
MDIVIIEIDLGKNSCSLAGMDGLGRVVLRRRMRRSSLESFAKGLGRCMIAMEAFWAASFVAPSGSCVHHVRDNFDAIEQTDVVKVVRARTYELVEFLHDILKVDAFPWASFPHRIGLHNSCGTLRRLKHARPSELHEPFFSKPMDLLSKVEGIEFIQPARPDECCGFGGTFSVFDEVVSTKMGYDKVRDHAQAGAEYIVSADSSCLMHQQGCAERIGVPMKFIHIAQILNGAIT